MPNYMMADRYYSSCCNITFFLPHHYSPTSRKGNKAHCPLCGRLLARCTSENWWVEKEYKK